MDAIGELGSVSVAVVALVLILREILPWVKSIVADRKAGGDKGEQQTVEVAVEKVFARVEEQKTLRAILEQTKKNGDLMRQMVEVWRKKECPVLGKPHSEAGD